MPYYPSDLKTLSLGVGLTPTIPQVFLYSTDNLHSQIINQSLYNALLESDITWLLLPSGDFLIMQSAAIVELADTIADFYQVPPDQACPGRTLLVTFISSSTRNLTGEINSSETTEIISPAVCDGSTTLTTFLLSLTNDLSDTISTELITTIL